MPIRTAVEACYLGCFPIVAGADYNAVRKAGVVKHQAIIAVPAGSGQRIGLVVIDCIDLSFLAIGMQMNSLVARSRIHLITFILIVWKFWMRIK